MDPTPIASVIVATIAAGAAYASQRSASKATKQQDHTHGRVEMEKEAYERARSYDTETIRRQNVEIEKLHVENKELKSKVDNLFKRVRHLEILVPPDVKKENDD